MDNLVRHQTLQQTHSVSLWILEEIHKLEDFHLGFMHPCNVLEADPFTLGKVNSLELGFPLTSLRAEW